MIYKPKLKAKIVSIESGPSIAPNAASPMIGHGEAPLEPPVSLIDFHGQGDTIIPFDADRPGSKAELSESWKS